jgi:hypothetical protein
MRPSVQAGDLAVQRGEAADARPSRICVADPEATISACARLPARFGAGSLCCYNRSA